MGKSSATGMANEAFHFMAFWWWPNDTGGYKRLQWVTRGTRGPQEVTGCYKGLQGVTAGYNGLQGITKYYR